MYGCSNTQYKGRIVPLDLPINTLLGKVQIKTATTIFSQSNAPYIFLYTIIKLRKKGEMKGGKTLKGKTSTTGMNKLQTWSPRPING